MKMMHCISNTQPYPNSHIAGNDPKVAGGVAGNERKLRNLRKGQL